MKDFTALHAALPDRVGDGLINVKKMMMIGSNFEVRIGLKYLRVSSCFAVCCVCVPRQFNSS